MPAFDNAQTKLRPSTVPTRCHVTPAIAFAMPAASLPKSVEATVGLDTGECIGVGRVRMKPAGVSSAGGDERVNRESPARRELRDARSMRQLPLRRSDARAPGDEGPIRRPEGR